MNISMNIEVFFCFFGIWIKGGFFDGLVEGLRSGSWWVRVFFLKKNLDLECDSVISVDCVLSARCVSGPVTKFKYFIQMCALSYLDVCSVSGSGFRVFSLDACLDVCKRAWLCAFVLDASVD